VDLRAEKSGTRERERERERERKREREREDMTDTLRHISPA